MLSENVMPSNIRTLINKKGINARKLAIASGVPAARISDILTGKTQNPRINTLINIADALGVKVDDLIADHCRQ